MFVKSLLGILLFSVVLCAQSPVDSSRWYVPWQEKMAHMTSIDSLEQVFARAEKAFANQPLRLLRIQYLFSRYYNEVLVRNLKNAPPDKRAALMARYGYSRQRWEKRILKFAQTASRVDTISDETLALFARQNKQAAKRILFYHRLKEQGMPDFSFTDMQGNHHHFSEYKGHFVLLFFWNRHSKPCLDELPALVKAHNMFGDKLRIIGVYVSFLQDPMEKEIVRNLIKEQGMDWPNILGSQAKVLKERFYLLTFPTNLLFDPELRLLNDPLDTKGRFQNEKLIPTLRQYLAPR